MFHMVLVKSKVSSIKWYTLGKKTKPRMNKTTFFFRKLLEKRRKCYKHSTEPLIR